MKIPSFQLYGHVQSNAGLHFLSIPGEAQKMDAVHLHTHTFPWQQPAVNSYFIWVDPNFNTSSADNEPIINGTTIIGCK